MDRVSIHATPSASSKCSSGSTAARYPAPASGSRSPNAQWKPTVALFGSSRRRAAVASSASRSHTREEPTISLGTQPDPRSRQQVRLIQVLLVEDSPADVELTRQALLEAKVANDVAVVVDGEAAMEFVHRSGAYQSAPRPDLILLDLNLPKKDGREVLAEIKSDPDLARIPVVVLTTSAAD